VNLWYRVRDLEAARAFYVDTLGFTEIFRGGDGGWMRLGRDGVEVALAEGTPNADADEAVLTFDVPDVRAEAERLRTAGVEVGVVLEIPGTIRLLDVYDPDGNRIQLTEDL
jgi:catechol 2,3-dioxygenase-like lactoylglutathione lyase family enzyme